MAVQDARQKPLALTQSIDFFSGRKQGLYQQIDHRTLNVLSTHDQFTFNSLAFMGARTEARQGRSDFWYARPRMRDTFAAELRLTWQCFFFGTRSRSSSERACWIGDVRSVFVFCFYFPMFVYQVETVPHIPLYMTSTYNSKTAVQYHMTPIYNSTLTTVQYRTFTDPLL